MLLVLTAAILQFLVKLLLAVVVAVDTMQANSLLIVVDQAAVLQTGLLAVLAHLAKVIMVVVGMGLSLIMAAVAAVQGTLVVVHQVVEVALVAQELLGLMAQLTQVAVAAVEQTLVQVVLAVQAVVELGFAGTLHQAVLAQQIEVAAVVVHIRLAVLVVQAL